MSPPDSRPRGAAAADEEIDVVALVETGRAWVVRAVRQRRLFVAPLIGAMALGLFVALGSTPEYQASTRLVPYASGGVSAGGLSGLAGLAGIRLPVGGTGDLTITSDLYPEVASTLDFVVAVAETPIAFSSEDSLHTAAWYFAERFRPAPLSLLVTGTLGLPGVVRSLVVPEAPASAASAQGLAPHVRRFDSKYRKIVEEIRDRLAVSYDKRTGVISVVATMPDPLAAADLVRASADRLTEFVIEHEVQKVDAQLRFIEQQYVEAKGRYDEADRALATFVDRNRVLVSATAQLERTRLEREVEISYEVLQQLVREREQARIKRNQNTPVFTVLEQATVPNERSRPRRTFIMFVAVVVGFLAGVSRLAWRELQATTANGAGMGDPGPAR